jgi:hypothetical protein
MRLESNYRSSTPTTDLSSNTAIQDAPQDASPDALAQNPTTADADLLSGNVLRGDQMLAAPFMPLVGYEIGRRAADPATPIVDKLVKLSPAKQLEYIHDLHAKDPAKFDALISSIRAGNITDPKVVLPAAFELAASTKFAASPEGKPVIDQLRKMYLDGKITMGPVYGNNLGITHPGKESDGRVGGKGTPSDIVLNTRLAGAPEALASVLAHEGLHALQYAKGQTPLSDLQVEVGASLVGARVWSEMGGDKEKVTGADAREMVRQMKGEAAVYDPNKSAADNQASMELQVATVYSSEFARSGDRKRFDEGARMINEILAKPNAADILKNASASDVRRLFYAYSTFSKAQAGPTSRANWQTLFDVMDGRNLWNVK